MPKIRLLELSIISFLTIAILAIGMSPIVYRFQTTPPDRVYLGDEFYTDDYSIYVSNVFQGQYGRWTLLDKHTNEPHLGTIIHDEYLLWGKLTGLFGIDQITSYHLMRLVMGAILLCVIYHFLKVIFPSSPFRRILSFLFITFAFGFPKISQSASGTTFGMYMDWLTELDYTTRFVALPHYLLGNIFFISALIFLIKLASAKKIELKYIVGASLSSLFAALIHPVAIVSLCFLLAIFLFLKTALKLSITPKIIKTPIKLINNTEFVYFLIIVITAAPIVLFYKYLFNIPPWNHMAAWEGVSRYTVPIKDFIGAIGPVCLLAPIGIISLIYKEVKKRSEIPLVLISWILSFFLLVYFSYPFLHISEVRFMQVFIFIPVSILAAEAVCQTSRFFKNKYIGVVLIASVFLISLPLYPKSFFDKLYYYKDYSMLAFPGKNWMEAIYWMRDNTPKDSVVLTAYHAGTTIPYNSGNTVYTGHFWATLDRDRKEKLKDKFLKGQMDEKEAYNFFKNERVNLLFWGYQEASYGGNPRKYPFLKEIYTNKEVYIFQFQP